MSGKSKRKPPTAKQWETPSLEWIHRVRLERQAERGGRLIHPLSKKEAEQLAKQYGLKIARPTTNR